MGLNQLTESVILSNTHTHIYTRTHIAPTGKSVRSSNMLRTLETEAGQADDVRNVAK